jgi:hypothetical protein
VVPDSLALLRTSTRPTISTVSTHESRLPSPDLELRVSVAALDQVSCYEVARLTSSFLEQWTHGLYAISAAFWDTKSWMSLPEHRMV